MKAFVSHASADAELATQLAGELRALGFEVWDGSRLLPGDHWFARAASAGVRRSLPTEVFLSHSSTDQAFVTELADALRRHGTPVWHSQTNILGAQ